MTDQGEMLLQLERMFWQSAGDPEEYSTNLADDALHVVPGAGIEQRNEALAGVASAAAWQSFSIDDPTELELGDGARALVYTTRAHRAGGRDYRAAVTSVYRCESGKWRLVLHQQTPLLRAGGGEL